MLKFFVLSLAVSCALGCYSRPSYEVVHDDQDLCAHFQPHASSEMNTTLLHYVAKAMLAFHIDDKGKQIRFDGNVDGWHAECLNEYTENDFECSILMKQVRFNAYKETQPEFRLVINAVLPRVQLVNLMIHVNLRFQSLQSFQITGLQLFDFDETVGFPPDDTSLTSIVDALLSGFHDALISINCKAS